MDLDKGRNKWRRKIKIFSSQNSFSFDIPWSSNFIYSGKRFLKYVSPWYYHATHSLKWKILMGIRLFGTIKEINNGKIRCIPFIDFSFNYSWNILYDFAGAFYVTAKKGFHYWYQYQIFTVTIFVTGCLAAVDITAQTLRKF